ncbi:MAG: hypothetical protein GVY13_14940 [Alphaproteobacteria bacterium]|nr:hypothetical protein [Alphaproteobacteria bacterium]
MKIPGQVWLTIDDLTRPIGEEPSATLRAWHDEETRQAIKEADAGDFATAAEIRAVIRKYVPDWLAVALIGCAR